MLNLPAPGGYELFAVAAALFCLALVPVSLTRATAPMITPSPRLKLRDLRFLAPVAILGCATSGLISSSFYSLVPASAQAQGASPGIISAYVATAIFGGLAFQIPIGKLSDRFDRRHVAVLVALGFASMALTLALLPMNFFFILVVTFIMGGFMSTIYPVCIAHANDRVDPERIVSVSGQLILVNGIASFLGPLLGAALLNLRGMEAVFLLMSLVALAFAVFATWRVLRIEGPEHKDRPFLILTENMGQSVAHVAEDLRLTAPEAVQAELQINTRATAGDVD
jgi:MFS family permease